METLRAFGLSWLDFLFPRSEGVESLEKLSASEMARTFPPPKPIDDERVIALFDYKHPRVREMIWEIKYKGNRTLARSASAVLYDVLKQEIAERALSENFKNPLLVPMPMSAARLRERGWNQTEIIARELIELDTEHLFSYSPDVLLKGTHTDSQARTHATRRERLAALENSMRVSPAPTQGRSGACIILLDDVTTTGATFAEARRALRAAGFKKIICVALAH